MCTEADSKGLVVGSLARYDLPVLVTVARGRGRRLIARATERAPRARIMHAL